MAKKHYHHNFCINEEKRLKQIFFIKDTERHTKKHGLSAKEMKDSIAFINNKADEMLEFHAKDLHAMRNFEDILFSLSND
eukprot:8158164-Ditylum_brightwellii.AAC.1